MDAVEMVTMGELVPYLDTLTLSLDRLAEITFAVGVMLAAWFLYSLFWRK